MGSPGKSPRAIQSRVYSVCRYSCTVIINHLRERHLRFQFPCTTLYPGRLNGVTQSNIWSTCYLWIPPRHLYYTNGTQLPSCRTSPPPPPSRETQATHNRELLILAWPLIPCFFSKIAIHWLPYHTYNITQKSKLANRAVSPKHHTCQKRPMTNPASSANKMILLSSNTIYNHLSKKSILTIKEIHINLTNHKDKRQKKSATGFGLVNGNNINLIHHGSDPEPDPKLHRTIPLKGLFWHDQIIATNPNLKTLILSWCHFYIITSLGW